ncbi:MAG TPA: helix-turn-helix domain-containing protein [Candidatus Peribacteraceae bacterium]|nr:helix-turn-helix domain-containing protein [Candidatus Peribacteraceae bacterium]
MILRSKEDRAFLEKRRKTAVDLHQQGEKISRIAKRSRVTVRSVSRWLSAYRAGGLSALNSRISPGRPKKLTKDQEMVLVKKLSNFRKTWTYEEAKQFIKRQIGIDYRPHSFTRLFTRLGLHIDYDAVEHRLRFYSDLDEAAADFLIDRIIGTISADEKLPTARKARIRKVLEQLDPDLADRFMNKNYGARKFGRYFS